MMKRTTHHSCQPGIDLVPKKDQKLLHDALMDIFDHPCRTTFYKHLRDYRNIPFNVKLSVDRLFSEMFGIPEEKVWKTWED